MLYKHTDMPTEAYTYIYTSKSLKNKQYSFHW